MSFRAFKKIAGPLKVVNLTHSVWETYLGNYFFGQTGPLTFGGGYNAWGALKNPPDSGVDMFWNVYTFSNFSSRPFTAEVWLNSTPPGRGTLSVNVASANQSINPPPKLKVELQFADHIVKPPAGGSFSFTRRVEPNYTLTRHDFQGMIIIPPGGSAVTYLISQGKEAMRASVAFGWWEQECKTSRELRRRILRDMNGHRVK
jgi:hypothetical protein